MLPSPQRGLTCHPSSRSRRTSGGWSGRRGSNPRPTAWKAVTLPLSYSRLRAVRLAPAELPRGSAGKPADPSSCFVLTVIRTRWLASRSSRFAPCFARDARERRLVAREGLEPSKPLGRQIYSLLRLTASLPRQLSVLLETRVF